jgi:glycosyltransferase involved in cell wall biosynthesis
MDLSIILPVYNEEKSIKKVIEDLINNIDSKKYNIEIIVVNDGSTDDTKSIAESCGVLIIDHPVNLGYGTALMTGIEKSNNEYIVTIDADGSYPVSEILKLLEYAEKFDLVIGARTGKEYHGTLIKYPARILFKWLAEFTAGVKIPDVNSGLRIFKKSAYKKLSLPLLCRGFSFSTTMTLSFLLTGLTVKFVPIKYLSREGHSKVRYIRDTLRTLQALTEVIIYYNPLKLILLLCVFPILFSVIFFYLYFIAKNPIWLFAGIASIYFTILFYILGLILDLLRMNRE